MTARDFFLVVVGFVIGTGLFVTGLYFVTNARTLLEIRKIEKGNRK